MRQIFLLILLLLPTWAIASENLIYGMSANGNSTLTDGVFRQNTADAAPVISWKLQVIYNNNKHLPIMNLSYEPIFFFQDGQTGFISQTFTTPNDLDDLLYFRFGVNGAERDTVIVFQIKDVQPNTTYTIQWRVLNNVQGEIAWTDMRVVHCEDGYSLALGEENCSLVCENKSVVGGYIPPDITKVYEPEVCLYDESKLICDDGYVRIDNVCEQMCTAGITHLHVGGNKNGLYARRFSSPALYIKYNDNICYGHLTPGHGPGLNVNIDGVVYHLID